MISCVPPLMFFYSITCTFCKKLYIGETERRFGDRFRQKAPRCREGWQGRIQTSSATLQNELHATIYFQNYIATVRIRKLPFSVGILNYHGFFTSSLTATHYREYSKSPSTHSSSKRPTNLHFLGRDQAKQNRSKCTNQDSPSHSIPKFA